MKLSKNLVTLDLETTGTWVEKDKIVEIGMIKTYPNGKEELYVKRVNPGIPIPPYVTELININDEDIKNEPFFRQIAREVVSFIGDADLCGFSIEHFDIQLLLRELGDAGLTLEMKGRSMYDAKKIYHVKEKRDLTAAYKFYCDKELTEAHSALADAKATLEILKAQVERYGEKDGRIEELKKYDYDTQGQYIDKGKKFRLWNGEIYPTFGKYARKLSVKGIAIKDPGYLEWILSEDFSDDAKDMIRNELEGNSRH